MFPGHSAHFPDLSFTGSVWFLLGRDSCGPFTSFFWNSLECKHHGSGTRSLKPGTDMFLELFEKHKEIQDLHLSLKLKENPSTQRALQRFWQSEKI